MQLKSHCGCADHSWSSTTFFEGQRAVVRVAGRISYFNQYDRHRPSKALPVRTNHHQWHNDLQFKFTLHPVVKAMLVHRPGNWHQLLLEWPHVSEKDPAQLAYTRDDAKGAADVQTLTSIGKYVARHWPKVPDHVRRDACLLFTPEKMYMVEPTTEAIIHAIQNGPRSCMRGDWDVHPYSVYSPALGWGMAVRTNPEGRIDGRALTWTDPDDEDTKVFARTYARNPNDPTDGYSHADQVLAAWLQAQGFSHEDWPEGARLAKFTKRGGPVLPYIDGDNQCVRDGCDTWIICDEAEAEYVCDNTNGVGSEVEDNRYSCEDCGDRMDQDDSCTVGRHEDRQVCQGCCNDRYRYVSGASSYHTGRTREYYVRSSQATCVGDEWYDTESLPDNIVELADGDYADVDDCCIVDDEYYLSEDCCIVDDEYYLSEDCVSCADGEYRLKEDCTECADGEWRADEDCVKCPDGESYSIDDCTQCADGVWRLDDDCTECTDDGEMHGPHQVWCCNHSGDWYSTKVAHVLLDGEKYHPDSVDEMRAETQVAPLFAETPEMATA